jgi:hypothetical protein
MSREVAVWVGVLAVAARVGAPAPTEGPAARRPWSLAVRSVTAATGEGRLFHRRCRRWRRGAGNGAGGGGAAESSYASSSLPTLRFPRRLLARGKRLCEHYRHPRALPNRVPGQRRYPVDHR